MTIHRKQITVPVKVYIVIILAIAIILSPGALSFIPVLLLSWYLSSWRWPDRAIVNLLTEYFVFFAIALLLSPRLGYLLPTIIALPGLALIDGALKDTAKVLPYRDAGSTRMLTTVGQALPITALTVMGFSLLLGSISLLLASSIILIYLTVLSAVILRRVPVKPVKEIQIAFRMVAGSKAEVSVDLNINTSFGGRLFLESLNEWLKISPNVLSLGEKRLATKVSLSPTLAGPSVVKLRGYDIDGWGLTQTRFEIEPIQLYVIPRARYAAWLARKYLASTKPGALPIISNIQALKPLLGLRRGLEYYGSQQYQPGDSLKNIDWKHSLKHDELITKEFTEFHGRPAIVLINLVSDKEVETDRLAYNIIVTAMSLARENIPTALAAYDHKDVKLTTTPLHPQQLVLQSLQIARELVIYNGPTKYLSPADVNRLRANLSRIRSSKSTASKVLTELLQLEYQSLGNSAKLNPATRALIEVFGKVDKQSNIVVISGHNHDAEALSFNTHIYTRRGNSVVEV